MTQAMLAQGWVVDFGGTPIPEVTNFDLGFTVAQVDVTNHDSTGGFREFIAGLKEPQEITITVNHLPASHATLFDIVGDDTAANTLSLTEPDASETYTVEAWVSAVVIHAPATGEAETADYTFRTTGPFQRSS